MYTSATPNGKVSSAVSSWYSNPNRSLPIFHQLRSGSQPTQPPTLSGTENEYQPKCGDALRLGKKGRYGSFHLWINVWVNLCDPSLTRAIPERFKDESWWSAVQIYGYGYFTIPQTSCESACNVMSYSANRRQKNTGENVILANLRQM